MLVAGEDPGFLERGFICIEAWGVAMLILSQFSKNITILFHFHRIFKNGGGRRGVKRTP